MKIAFKQCIQKNFVAHLLAHAWAPRINTSPAPVSEHPGSMTRAAFTDHVNPYTTSRPVADFFLKKHFLTKTWRQTFVVNFVTVTQSKPVWVLGMFWLGTTLNRWKKARARNLLDWWTAEANAGLAGLAEFNRKTSVVNIHEQILGARILTGKHIRSDPGASDSLYWTKRKNNCLESGNDQAVNIIIHWVKWWTKT